MAATPISRASHMPLAAPRPWLPRSHNAPIVCSSARLPPGEQLRAKGLGRALMPGVLKRPGPLQGFRKQRQSRNLRRFQSCSESAHVLPESDVQP